MIFFEIVNDLDNDVFNIPLTVNLSCSARIIRIEGSETDGVYTNRTGSISFNALPNKEITIEIIER